MDASVKGDKRGLTMRFAPQSVIHLGLHTYTGPVPAMAELIANAWDADASTVELEIPFDQPWAHESSMIVRDDGCGMDYADCEYRFLVVGRDRRQESKFTAGDRPVMGHKGLGKLGCFGIAKIIEVRTVKDGKLMHFRMDFDEMMRLRDSMEHRDYHPKLLADEEPTEEPAGTTITIKRIQLNRAIRESGFRDSMARRFAVLSSDFQVFLNGIPLTKDDLDYEFRFPDCDWNPQHIPGLGAIEWWAGFTKTPVKYHHARGMAVITRGRLAQEPFFFRIAGGFTGQVAQQYLVGEVKADMLDEDEDLIATGRSTILWEHHKAQLLLDWGQKKVKELCGLWLDARVKKRLEHLNKATNYLQLIENYPSREKKELTTFVRKVVTVPGIEDERLQDLVLSVVNAYGDRVVIDLIRDINAAENPEEFTRLIADWNVVEAIRVYKSVKGRLAIIDRLEEMIAADVREKPDLQDFISENPWLLNPSWEVLEHEKTLDKVIAEHFRVEPARGEGGRLRLDFFCLRGPGFWVVVELKRPGHRVKLSEIVRFSEYVDYLRDHAERTTEPRARVDVTGKLIASDFADGTLRGISRLAEDRMYVTTWEQFLREARDNHSYLLYVAKRRAPERDPRVQALETIQFEGEYAGS